MNRYCDRLQIDPPRLEDFADRPELKLFHLMQIALLEKGSAMTLDELADRLEEVGVWHWTGDLPYALKKAWHGLAPVVQDDGGLFGFDMASDAFRYTVYRLGLAQDRQPPEVPSAPLAMPGPEVPLSKEEVVAAFKERGLYSVSGVRQAAAVLDCSGGGPLPLEWIEAFLDGLTRNRGKLTSRAGWPEPVDLDSLGRLVLVAQSPAVAAMRRQVRTLAHSVLERERASKRFEATREARQEDSLERYRREAAQARASRRAIVHVEPSAADPAAAAVLDIADRTIRTFCPLDAEEFRRYLGQFDVLAGLGIRNVVRSAGLDPDSLILTSLDPPKKTKTLNKQGRKLTITTDLLIAGTTGISKPLGDPAKKAAYAAEADWGRLARRLASDVKALHAYYRYGVLQGAVRLRWGFLDEFLGVDWPLPGDPSLYALLKAAGELGEMVRWVVGTTPGWEHPQARSEKVRILALGYREVEVETFEGTLFVDPGEIRELWFSDAVAEKAAMSRLR